MSILIVNSNAEMIPLADESVHAVVTSPPYYGLRKYAIDGDAEIGLEDTPEAYLERMVAVFREVKRVLRADGVVWVNMGDSYSGSGKGQMGDGSASDRNGAKQSTSLGTLSGGLPSADIEGYKPLDLMNIPARLVLALQADGWYHRSTIIWAKPNPMPESVSGWRWERHKVNVGRIKADWNILPKGWDTGEGSHDTMGKGNYRTEGEREATIADLRDCPGCEKCAPHDGLVLRKGSWRPTTAHEYIFMLTKTSDYFADGEAVREGISVSTLERWGNGGTRFDGHNDYFVERDGGRKHIGQLGETGIPPSGGRNARTVWTFPTQPYPGAHFATYPEELPRRCLKASISEQGCCPTCGCQWARCIGERSFVQTGGNKGAKRDNRNPHAGSDMLPGRTSYLTTGFLPTCTCPPHEPVPAVVLDIFAGSGTTGIVARELGAHFIGLDLSYPYLHDQARDRLGLTALDAWAQGKGKQDGKVISDLPLFEVTP